MIKFDRKYFHFAISTLLLMGVVFCNFYPLVTSDSGTYINHAFHLGVARDRPVFYSFFIAVFSLRVSLYLVVLMQCVLLSFLLQLLLKQFFPLLSVTSRLLIILFTVIFSSVSWFTAQIMPDIFTSMLGISALLYLYVADRTEKRLLLIIFIFSAVSHNANLITATVFLSLIWLGSFLIKSFRKKFSRLSNLSVGLLGAWFLVCCSNYIGGYSFSPSPTSHVFLMGKLCENGILKEFLNQECSVADYKLCRFKEELPKHAYDFVWASDGAFAKTGGWDSSKQEYSTIIKRTITESKYIQMHIKASWQATFQQLFLTQVGDGLNPQVDGSNPFWKIQESFHYELPVYLASKQNQSKLHFDGLNKFYWFSFIFSLFLIVTLLMVNRNVLHLKIVIFISLFVLCNAFSTATFANVLARLNSRDIWLLIFIAIALLVNYIQVRIKSHEHKI